MVWTLGRHSTFEQKAAAPFRLGWEVQMSAIDSNAFFAHWNTEPPCHPYSKPSRARRPPHTFHPLESHWKISLPNSWVWFLGRSSLEDFFAEMLSLIPGQKFTGRFLCCNAEFDSWAKVHWKISLLKFWVWFLGIFHEWQASHYMSIDLSHVCS